MPSGHHRELDCAASCVVYVHSITPPRQGTGAFPGRVRNQNHSNISHLYIPTSASFSGYRMTLLTVKITCQPHYMLMMMTMMMMMTMKRDADDDDDDDDEDEDDDDDDDDEDR